MKAELKEKIKKVQQYQVPDGYKKTDVGIVPSDWEVKNLKSVGKFKKGKGLPGTEMKSVGIPCIGYGDIYTKYNYKFEKALNFVDKNVADESIAVDKGTLLFTCSGETAIEIGKCVCYDGDETIYAGGDIAILNLKDCLNPLFVAYQQNIFSLIKQKARYGQGHSVVHIYSDSLGKLCVAYPKDINEQKCIADVLSKWDEAIDLQEKLIDKLEMQKKAIMQKLLTPKSDWINFKVKDLFEITRGQVLSVDNCDDLCEYPVYSSQTKDDGLLGYYSEYLFENAITWTTDGANAGKVSYRKGKFYCTNVCGVLINKNGYANSCFAYLLDLITPKYVSYVGNPKLMNNVMGNIKLSAPKIDDQLKISHIIDLIDERNKLYILKLETLKQQRKALQQLLLTGIVRVK